MIKTMRLPIIFFLCFAVLWAVTPVLAESVPQSREQITLSFAPLVKQVSPAVVNIYTKRVVQQRVSPLFADPLFSQFFGNMVPRGMTRERMENSLGSGVIVRADGLIVTSNHVIRGADEIRVVLSDRREFDASVLTTDEHSDLAVLRVDAKGENLPFIELKDSDDAQVGDLVLAIGNPFGVGRTVTSGIISAVTHAAVGSSDLDYFIQTDAAINPGNSGGALVTMDGRLVGINAAIYSRDGGNLGIGFAVPSNMVRVVLSAVEGGKTNIVRPWLGVDGQGLTAELAASMNIDKPSGFLVNSIHPASPALKAGLAIGDVIMMVNGRVVEDPESFRYRVATLPVGSVVEFGILRKGQPQTVRINLIAPPEDPPRNKTVVSGQNPLAGAVIENLSPAVMEELGLRGSNNGVIIASIKPNAVAENIGLQNSDIILAINGQKMKTVNDVSAALKQPTRGWRITILRDENQITLMVGG
jgi:serine protease Do